MDRRHATHTISFAARCFRRVGSAVRTNDHGGGVLQGGWPRRIDAVHWSAQRTLRRSPPRLGVSAVMNHQGFTLVEALVAITIVGSLMALLLPAVQASRERSRQTVCSNNLRQQALAAQQHLQAFGRFPSNGWGYLWVGDPNRGNDLRQPGGWIYNLIVYTQPKTHRDLGKSGDVRGGGRAAFERLLSEPAPLFVCPSRGDGRPRPAAPWLPPFNAEFRPLVAKTDYAICEGDYITDTQGGPDSLRTATRASTPGRTPPRPPASAICAARCGQPTCKTASATPI
jgi:prepilin-type N-terminal cleavage/methylation domain-containing protein